MTLILIYFWHQFSLAYNHLLIIKKIIKKINSTSCSRLSSSSLTALSPAQHQLWRPFAGNSSLRSSCELHSPHTPVPSLYFWPSMPENTHTHTHTKPFNGLWSRTPRVGRYQKKHSPIHTHPDHQTSFINFLHFLLNIHDDPQHPLCSVYVLDSAFPQPLSRSSLVFDPLLHTN